MIVCVCHRISDRQIRQAVQDGVRDFEELQDDTCLARNCACCEDCAREVFDQALAATAPAGARAPATATVAPITLHRPLRDRDAAPWACAA